MHHVGQDELAHARWKSKRLLEVVSLSFGVGETSASRASTRQRQVHNHSNLTSHLYLVIRSEIHQHIIYSADEFS